MVYRTPALKLSRLSANTWIHESYLQTSSWGKVGCNGLVYITDGEAVVMDTPTDSLATAELLIWIRKQEAKPVGIIVNHFHNDCLGTLPQFHKAGIPSFASEMTKALAQEDQAVKEAPQQTFTTEYTLNVGKHVVVSKYLGPAHTRDNIVTYVPSEKVLFGGCMVKEIGANRGYIGDADTLAWAKTIRAVGTTFPDAKVVVPGHGKPGDRALLRYTEQMWKASEAKH